MDNDELATSLATGAALAVGGIKASFMVGKLIKLGRGFVKNGDDNLAEFVREETAEAVFRLLPEIEKRVKALEDQQVDVKGADVANIGSRFTHTTATAADPRKRKLLEDAFLRSFDREFYESGLLNVLWGCLDRLSYGDLIGLRELAPYDHNNAPPNNVVTRLMKKDSMERFHARNLLREGLVYTTQTDPEKTGDFRPTELGRKLIALALEQDKTKP